MRNGLIILLCLLLALSTATCGQEASAQSALRLPTRAFTADDGLGGATITSLLKDARGFLWIGTPDELLVYDGTRFQPFRYTDKTGSPQAFRRAYLFSVRQHGVFIAHEDGTHQFVLPSGQLRAVATPFNDFTFRSSIGVVDAASSVYRASTSTHTARYDPQRLQWSEVRRYPLPQLNAAAVTPGGRTFLGCDTGTTARTLHIHDRPSGRTPEDFDLPFRARCVLRLVEGALFIDANGDRDLWWMPNGGMLKRIAQLRSAAHEISATYASGGAAYLAAGHSLLRFFPAAGEIQEILREDGTAIVRSGIVTHLLPDGRTLWVGSNTTGLIHVSLDGTRLRHLRADSAVLNWSHAIHADLARGRIYVGGYGGTVAVFDTAAHFVEDLTLTLRRAGGRPSAYINAIEPLPDGRLFILGGLNAWIYNPATRWVQNIASSADKSKQEHRISTTDYMGRRGVLRVGPWEWWISEKIGALRWRIMPTEGAQRMRMEIAQVIRISPPAPEAFAQYAGGWWCATSGRLYQFGERGLQDSFHYPITAFATCLAPDAQGRLWIGTESGIAVWRGGKVERVITTESGLPNNHVYALLPDGAGRMWGSTNSGLFAIRTADFSVRAFTGGEGLQGAEFNLGAVASDGKGRLYFGGMNGVNVVEPAVALRQEATSPVTITRVSGADTVYHVYPGAATPPSLRLLHDRASLQISFSSPQPESAGPLRFEYRLRADDSVWTDNGTRRELQLFLAPGEYRVEVRVQGAPETAAVFSVEVMPPFYQAWWFVAALAVAGGAVLALAVVSGNRRRYRQQLATLETARHIQEEKERISRELHDELGARAALLSHNASLLKEAQGSGEVAPLTERITETTADMLTALRETVWTLKQEAITAESLWLRYKNFIAKLWATYSHIHFVVEEDSELPTTVMDYARALHLLRILQEATMNAVKHAGASTVTAVARMESNGLCFAVTDDGRGFDVDAARESGDGNGLHNMAHRSAEGELSLTIKSRVPHGTVVEVRIA